MKTSTIIVLLLTGITCRVQAQTDSLSFKKKASLPQYLRQVGKENLGYAAQQYNINIAEAGIEIAKIFPDPELSVSAFDNQQSTLKLGRGLEIGLGTTLELGGKRRARINLAKSETALNKSLLEDYFRNLRADAALAYYDAVYQYTLLQVQRSNWRTMQQLADADATRFKLGEITETDARQSQLEATNMLNVTYQNEADWINSLLKLNGFTRHQTTTDWLIPDGNFLNLHREIDLQNLIGLAQSNRSDALVALNTKTVANKNLSLVKANRAIDLGINAGLTLNGVSVNEEAPTPYHRTTTVGISIPLKFSNYYKGDLKTAQFTIKQAGLQYEQVLQQIQTEVTQAFTQYKVSQKKVVQYQNGMLKEARKILDAKIYSYKRGESSLLEVLNAQRTYNDVQQGYYESQLAYAAALVELERAAGIWDLM